MQKFILLLCMIIGFELLGEECAFNGTKVLNPGLESQPFPTIREALFHARPGSSIEVGSGIADEVIEINGKGDLTIYSECGAKVNRIQVRRSQKITIHSLVIRPDRGHGVTLEGGSNASSDITIRNLDLEPRFVNNTLSGISIGNLNEKVQIVDSKIKSWPNSGIVIGKGARLITLNSSTIEDNLRHGVIVQDEVELTIQNSKVRGNGRLNLHTTSPSFGIANSRSDASTIKISNSTISFNFGCIQRSIACDISNPSFIDDITQSQTTYGTERGGIAPEISLKEGPLPLGTESYLSQTPATLRPFLKAFIVHVRSALNTTDPTAKNFASLREQQIKNCLTLVGGSETQTKIVDIIDIDSGKDFSKLGLYLKRHGEHALTMDVSHINLTFCSRIANSLGI